MFLGEYTPLSSRIGLFGQVKMSDNLGKKIPKNQKTFIRGLAGQRLICAAANKLGKELHQIGIAPPFVRFTFHDAQ
jgi:hypothetical protein